MQPRGAVAGGVRLGSGQRDGRGVVIHVIDVATHLNGTVVHEVRVAVRQLGVAMQDTGDVLTPTRHLHLRAGWPGRDP